MLHPHFVAYLIVCQATTSVSSSKQPFQSPFQNYFSFFFNTAISVSSPTKQCPRGKSPQNTPRPQTLCVSQTHQRDVADKRHLRAAGRQGDIEFLELKMPTSEKKSLVSGISETQEELFMWGKHQNLCSHSAWEEQCKENGWRTSQSTF